MSKVIYENNIFKNINVIFYTNLQRFNADTELTYVMTFLDNLIELIFLSYKIFSEFLIILLNY